MFSALLHRQQALIAFMNIYYSKLANMSIPADAERQVIFYMKKIVLLTFLLISTVYILPSGYNLLKFRDNTAISEHIVANVKDLTSSDGKNEQSEKKLQTSSSTLKTGQKSDDSEENNARTIAVSIDGVVQEMRLEEYVAGVTAAEIPASFPLEALKAQAVAARTFAQARTENGSDDVHPDAAVCDDYTHCAAYLDLASQAKKQWGDDADECRAKIEQAVQETAGQVVVYDGEPITAVFHAACSEETESALDVWGADVPYLVSVDSEGDEDCPDYTSSVTFGAEEFRQLMLKKCSEVNLTGLPGTWFTDFERADSGNVLKCTVGGVKAKGTTLRSLLGLRSTNFTVSTTETSITFDTTGYGHAVGMSQYGAKAMAEAGSSFEEILTHYYSGTEVVDMADLE